MMKTFPYAVIWNGEFVPANTPIEVEEVKAEKTEAKTEETEKPKRAVRKNAGT